MLLVLLTSSPSYSDPYPPDNLAIRELPKWANIDGNACYRIAGARILKHYETNCSAAFAKLPKLSLQVGELTAANIAQDKAYLSLQAALVSAEEEGVSQEALLDAQVEQLATLEQWYLLGPAGMWVAAGGVVVFLTGALTGAWLVTR